MYYLTSYLQFAVNNGRFVGFGFVMLLASSFGQTFFIGLFGPAVRAEFDLTHTSWSAVYTTGTLMSALILPWTGQMIDRVALPRYAVVAIIALTGATIFMALAPSVAFLVVAIFLLRQTGQGLMSHTGTTAMARYFPADRGKAIGLASLGFAVGEATLPVLMVLTIAMVGWRMSYGMVSLTTLLIVLPTALWLLKGHHARHRTHEDHLEQQHKLNVKTGSRSRRDVLEDYRFYLLLPAALAPSFIGTALFFHHLPLAELKGWNAAWFTGSYWIYAVGSVIAALAAGPLIDRLTAVRVLPTSLLPLALGLILVWAFDNAWWALPYLFLVGVTSGIMYTGLTALWAEIYGVKNLGAIKSLNTAISVFASALGPLAMGVMMDKGISVENICAVFAGYCLVASWLLVMGLKGYRRHATESA